MTKLTKKAQISFIKEKITHDDKWALRALLCIYNKQTASEKEDKTTTDENGVGFTGVDAEFLSSLAEQYNKRGSLSLKQIAMLKKAIGKYSGQLLAFSNKEILAKAMENANK